MQSRAASTLPETEFNLYPLKSFLLLTPPLSDTIAYYGEVFPSPIKAHVKLKLGITDKEYQTATEIDQVLRFDQSGGTPIATYEKIMLQIDIMMCSIKYHFDHFDDEMMDSLKQMPTSSHQMPTFIYFMQSEYVKCYTALFRCKLDTIDQYIKRQRNMLNQENSALSKRVPGMPADTTIKRALEENVKAGYAMAEKCITDATAQLESMKDENSVIVDARWKFQLYQRYVEILLFKSTTERESNRRNIKSLGTRRWLDLAEHYAKQINTIDHDMEFLILRARHDQCIDNSLAHAKKSIEAADKLFAIYKASENATTTNIVHFTNHIAVVKMSIILERIEKNLKDVTHDILIEAIQTILNTKETIKFGMEMHRSELTIVLDMVLGVVESKIRSDLIYPKMEKLEALLRLIELARESLSYFEITETIIKFSSKHEQALNLLHETVTGVIQVIKKQEVDNLEAAAKLAEKEAEYERNFEKSMKEFAKSTKSILNKRQISIVNFARLCPISSPTPATSANETAIEPATGEPTPPTLAQRAADYFQGCHMTAIESFLDTLTPTDDRAAALLLIGDRYYRKQLFDKALLMYEACINETNLMPAPNEEVVEGLQIQLTCTKELIEKRIKYLEVSMNVLQQMRDQFIVKLGRQKLQQEGGPENAIELNEQELYEAAYERGYKEYVRLGENNRNQGKPLSEPAQHLQMQKGSLAFLKTTLELTSILMNKVSNKPSGENFPSLTSNPSALFKDGKKTRMPNYNKAIGKQTRKKKR